MSLLDMLAPSIGLQGRSLIAKRVRNLYSNVCYDFPRGSAGSAYRTPTKWLLG
jgi:hypothetical protein